MKPYHTTQRGHIYRARAEDVYPHLPDRSCSLVIWDGPYNMRKADWDKFDSWDAFRDWYRPHLEALDRVACEAASLYVWGTNRSAGALRDLIESAGWAYKGTVTWDKRQTPALLAGDSVRTWPDAVEVCDLWTRGRAPFTLQRDRDGTWCKNVWRLNASNANSPLVRERLRSGPLVIGKNKNRPMLQRPTHPCQKPLIFWSRIIYASSHTGDTVLEPFGGTCRSALACLDLPEGHARRYVCIEPDEDGRDYLGAVVKSLRERQPTLWGVR